MINLLYNKHIKQSRYLKVYCKIKRQFQQGFLRAKPIFATSVAKEKGMKNHPFFLITIKLMQLG